MTNERINHYLYWTIVGKTKKVKSSDQKALTLTNTNNNSSSNNNIHLIKPLLSSFSYFRFFPPSLSFFFFLLFACLIYDRQHVCDDAGKTVGRGFCPIFGTISAETFYFFFLFAWSVAAWKTYQCKSIARWQILSCTFYSVARLPDQIFRLTYSRCLRVVCECCWWWWMVALLRYVACNHISSGNANELLIWYFKVFRSFTCEQSDEFSGEAGKDNYRTIVHASKV